MRRVSTTKIPETKSDQEKKKERIQDTTRSSTKQEFFLTYSKKIAEENHPRSCQDTKAQEEEEEMKNKIFKAPKIKKEKILKNKKNQTNKKPIKTNNVHISLK